MLHLDHNRSHTTHLAKLSIVLAILSRIMVHWITISADDVEDIVGRKWIVLQLGLVRPGKVKSLWFHSSVPSLNKHSSLVLRSLKTNILSGAQAKPQMQVIFRHRLSFKTWRLTFMQDRNFFSCWKSTLSENGDQSCFGNKEIRGTFETGCAAYASNRSLGERWTSRAAERQMVGALELNEMLEGRRDFHVVLCVPAVCPSVSVHHQDTSTVPHQGFMLQSIARACTKGERDKNRATVASRRLLKEGETDA